MAAASTPAKAPAGNDCRVGLFGRLGSGNLGNDATLEAVLAHLADTRADVAIDAMSSSPERVSAQYGIPATHMHWLHVGTSVRWRPAALVVTAVRIGIGLAVDTWRTARWVRGHDVVIVPGMGVLEATLPVRPWQMPWSLFLLSAFGRLFGARVVLLGVGASPVPRGLNRWLLTRATSLAAYRSFRDEYSRDAMRRMGVDTQDDPVYADLVFSLPVPEASVDPAMVAVGVMAWYGADADHDPPQHVHDAYLATMSEFVSWLLGTGHRVRLIVGDSVDEPVARAIVRDQLARTPEAAASALTFEPVTDFTSLLRQVAGTQAVVASRFHNVIAAVKCGRPTIAVGYGEKHSALMAGMGVGDFCLPIRRLAIEELRTAFAALEANREQVTRTLSERNAHRSAVLEHQFADLSALLPAAIHSGRN